MHAVSFLDAFSRRLNLGSEQVENAERSVMGVLTGIENELGESNSSHSSEKKLVTASVGLAPSLLRVLRALRIEGDELGAAKEMLRKRARKVYRCSAEYGDGDVGTLSLKDDTDF